MVAPTALHCRECAVPSLPEVSVKDVRDTVRQRWMPYHNASCCCAKNIDPTLSQKLKKQRPASAKGWDTHVPCEGNENLRKGWPPADSITLTRMVLGKLER